VNAAVTPDGNPVTEKDTALLKVEFGVLVNVTELKLPAATAMELAPDNTNAGAAATVTESAT
jgi:hypothetical protein